MSKTNIQLEKIASTTLSPALQTGALQIGQNVSPINTRNALNIIAPNSLVMSSDGDSVRTSAASCLRMNLVAIFHRMQYEVYG